MAAIQSQLPAGFRRSQQRTLVLPERKIRRTRSVTIPDLPALTATLAGAALIVIIYISGFARMTAVSYQRALLMQQIGDLRVKSQLVQTKLTERTVKDVVATWALENGMSPANGHALVLGQEGQAR
jgi:hypothetical protein